MYCVALYMTMEKNAIAKSSLIGKIVDYFKSYELIYMFK